MYSVIRAAIPAASDDLCEFILWERTPFPVGRLDAKSLFKAASRMKRAAANKVMLCDMCNNKVTPPESSCPRCKDVLQRISDGD